jgi:sugar lactone lactonase YvrE
MSRHYQPNGEVRMDELKPTVLAEGWIFGESPRWRDGVLWFVDMHGHKVLTMDADGQVGTEAEFEDQTSGLGFLHDGSAIVVLKYTRQVMRIYPDRRIEVYADFRSQGPKHLNDMVVDSHGRAYVDTNFYMPRENTPLSITDRLSVIYPDGRILVVAEGMLGPNGLAITGDGRTLVVAEIRDRKLSAFDIDPVDGTLSNKQPWASTGPDKRPDGICLDVEGGVWYACPDSHVVTRVMRGGEVTDVVSVGRARNAFACCLGGSDRKTLYIMTSEMDSNFKAQRGFVEAVRVEIPGDGIP